MYVKKATYTVRSRNQVTQYMTNIMHSDLQKETTFSNSFTQESHK